MEPKTLDVAYKRLLSKAGLPDFRLHDLRHTFSTNMLELGEYPKVVSEMLGHSSVAITLDLYSHVTPTLQKEGRRPHGCGPGR